MKLHSLRNLFAVFAPWRETSFGFLSGPIALLLFAGNLLAADPWHLPEWQTRAVVEILQPSKEAGVDTAGVKVLCQGQANPDGTDYRVLDAAGRPVPFQIMFHDPARYSLISFRAANPKDRYFIYFGNAKATPPPEQVAVNPVPGSGQAKGAWIPRQGLVYQTIQRPQGENPKTVEELAKMLAASKIKYGARYQRGISDGYNPFGPSDMYMSIYRGWINIPKAGKYRFCTVSNEASFSFMDGKELIHWPGRHTVDRGIRGEKNALIELTAGLHYLEYYHEEVTLEQMAFLGWRQAEDEGPFSAIPEAVYPAPHAGAVVRYETTKGPLLYYEPLITDSIWPMERHEGQYTRCKFQVGKTPPQANGTTYRWDFGDGQTATGPDVEHVYLVNGTYQTTLTSQGPGGASTAKWPLEIFEIDNVTDQFKEGKPKDYAQLAKKYDRTKLDANALKELAFLLVESEEFAEVGLVGEDFIKRFSAADAKMTSRVRRLMADCALRTGKGGIEEAIKNYEASITKETPSAEKIDVLGRLITLVGIDRAMPDKAGSILEEVSKSWEGSKRDEETQAAYRRAVIAAGDVLLWNAKPRAALDLYKQAESLSENKIPDQVRAARVGAYPNALREFIAGGSFGAALDIVKKWEETFPTDKPKGQTFFWRGKVLALRGQPQDAARFLARSIGLAPGATFETEARWLLAQALEQLGKTAEAKGELAALVKSGISDSFTKMAGEKLLKQGNGNGKKKE